MTLTNWILLAAFLLNIGLLITANIKQLIILQKTCACLTFPIAGTLITLQLSLYLPDSFHIILISIIAFSLVCLSTAFLAFERIKILRVLGRITSLGNIVCWLHLYSSIFKIHSVPVWLYILFIFIYAAILVATCIISGKQELKNYGFFSLSFLLAAYLHFSTLIFLCFERTGSSIMLFTGASIYSFLVIFHFINTTKLKITHAGGIRYILLVISQILIACSNILMIK